MSTYKSGIKLKNKQRYRLGCRMEGWSKGRFSCPAGGAKERKSSKREKFKRLGWAGCIEWAGQMIGATVIFRYVSSSLWSAKGRICKAFAKGPTTTSWIFNIHAGAHDFDSRLEVETSYYYLVTRKVFSSNLAHLSAVFFWLAGLHYAGAYFSNYGAWLRDPVNNYPSAQILTSLVGQDCILNSKVGYFEGIYITSGLFSLWRSEGIITQVGLKSTCTAALSFSLICLLGAYLHMHDATGLRLSFSKKIKSISIHDVISLLGLGSISFAGHQYHISVGVNRLLDSGINPVLIGTAQDLLSSSLWFTNLTQILVRGQICLMKVCDHHLYVGVTCILAGFLLTRTDSHRADNICINASISASPTSSFAYVYGRFTFKSFHAQLSISSLVLAQLSIAFAHHGSKIPVYPYVLRDYPIVLCLFVHHMWIGGFLTIGAAGHGVLYMVQIDKDLKFSEIICHRDIITGHLIWVCIFLGFHSFGLYIHNDTLEAIPLSFKFQDGCIPLRPVFATWIWDDGGTGAQVLVFSFDIKILDRKVFRQMQEFGTADFLVHHIHAFTIHVTLLISGKAVLYSRSSRQLPDKGLFGFLYPCDGPGRGGTCQISSADHIFLACFWIYNTISIVLFHFFWKNQSDVWACIKGLRFPKAAGIVGLGHITSGDFSINSVTINGWLRNFLWSQAAQVIQSYSSSLSAYGLIFLSAHFIWAFSLMFLYSGRGYWEELIESILWAHHKLKVVPHIVPRALSISEGRAVGLGHYLLGGIGTTWAFLIARIVALST